MSMTGPTPTGPGRRSTPARPRTRPPAAAITQCSSGPWPTSSAGARRSAGTRCGRTHRAQVSATPTPSPAGRSPRQWRGPRSCRPSAPEPEATLTSRPPWPVPGRRQPTPQMTAPPSPRTQPARQLQSSHTSGAPAHHTLPYHKARIRAQPFASSQNRRRSYQLGGDTCVRRTEVCCVASSARWCRVPAAARTPPLDVAVGFPGWSRKRCSSSRAFRLTTPRPTGARTRRSARPRRGSPSRRCPMS